MIVCWGLDELPDVLGRVGVERPLLITSRRWAGLELPVAARFEGVEPHVPLESVERAAAAGGGADGLVALGGGSAIDTTKAVSARTGLRMVSIPTTYSGAEWTTGFGMRDPERRLKRGGGGANLGGIVYEPELTLGLPRAESGGTALNALAHCAEALYVTTRTDEGDLEALEGARLIGEWLPAVLADGSDIEARTHLLEGAMHAGAALAAAGLALGHALAQALGGRFGLPHGALNALCLPAALRFNEPVASDAITRFAEALGTDDAARRVEELARLAGFSRLRDLGVPQEELGAVAAAAAERPGAKANPRQASPVHLEQVLQSIW